MMKTIKTEIFFFENRKLKILYLTVKMLKADIF